MQYLTRSELHQITEVQNQSRDMLEKIARMRRIKNYEDMIKGRVNNSSLKIKTKHPNFLTITLIII